MFYIGVVCMILFTLSRVLHLKKALDKHLGLEEIDEAFVSRIND